MAQTEQRLRDCVSARGYSISAGYAMRAPQADLDDVIRESDKRMYEDKERYYRAHGDERRK